MAHRRSPSRVSSRPRGRRRRLLGAAAASFVCALGAMSCDDAGLIASPGNGALAGGGGLLDSGTATTTAGSDGGDAGPDVPAGCDEAPPGADSCKCGAAPPGADTWSPQTDSCWTPVAWPAPCAIQVADQPKLAMPKLEWVPCSGGEPGCTKQVEEWWPGVRPIRMASVIRTDNGFRVGMTVKWALVGGDVYQRAVVYEADGTPMTVWRTTSDLCLSGIHVTSERVWFGSDAIDDETGAAAAAYIVEPYDNLAKATKTLPITHSNQGSAATDDVLSLWYPGGGEVGIYDRLTNKLSSFGGLSFAPHTFYPVAGGAFGICAPSATDLDGCAWDRATNTVEKLVEVPNGIVPDIKSDGQTVVWVELPQPENPFDPLPAGDLWTSPWATKKATLAPTKRRPSPERLTIDTSIANEGYYAVASQTPVLSAGLVHVYRLSDMHHWQFNAPKDGGVVIHIIYVDANEVWFFGAGPIIRQKLDALGPGDPAP